jgi:uncharacterized membrane protein YedE/YeeE
MTLFIKGGIMYSFINPLVGGMIIGLSASLLLLFKGRIFGVTGILAGALGKPTKSNLWQIAVVMGLISGSFFLSLVSPDFFDYSIPRSTLQLVIAGLLVGFGTRLGGGCTSGHGVCGLPRLSLRSILATITFMISGAITVSILGGV